VNRLRAVAVLAAIFVVGFVAFGWAWHGARHATYVPLQAPWVISGGLGAIALIGLAIVAWHIDLARRDDLAHREQWDDFTEDLAAVLFEHRK
jgi:hypothetical protein